MVRATLIGAMLGGGLLFAGLSQAQDAGIQAERGEELIAAVGGPESNAHLIPYLSDKATVEVRDADVAGSPTEVGDVATQGSVATPSASSTRAAPASAVTRP